MTSLTSLNQSFALGFDELERALERVTRLQPDGYPPFNIERLKSTEPGSENLRIVIAVAGFKEDLLDITLEGRQLTVTGRKGAADEASYLHQGIATRQFQRSFILADTVEIDKATLKDGLLSIALKTIEPVVKVKKIKIYCD